MRIVGQRKGSSRIDDRNVAAVLSGGRGRIRRTSVNSDFIALNRPGFVGHRLDIEYDDGSEGGRTWERSGGRRQRQRVNRADGGRRAPRPLECPAQDRAGPPSATRGGA